MKMTLRDLYLKEKQESRLRLKKDSQGTEPLLYIAVGFAVFLGALLGGQDIQDWFISVYSYTLINVCSIFAVYIRPVLYVLERGKKQPILNKYVNVPIDLKLLCVAKLMVISAKLGKLALLSFLVALLFRILDGGDLSSAGLLPFPFFLGGVLWACTAAFLWWQYTSIEK